MTTIAYHHATRTIAVDSRTTSGGRINTDKAIKWIEKDGEFWFVCGSVCDTQRFIDYVTAGGIDAQKHEIDCHAIIARGGKVYHCAIADDGAPCTSPLDYDEAIGSGFCFAIGAMDHGKTAQEAVEYAKTRDSATGGDVHVFDLSSMAFIEVKK